MGGINKEIPESFNIPGNKSRLPEKLFFANSTISLELVLESTNFVWVFEI